MLIPLIGDNLTIRLPRSIALATGRSKIRFILSAQVSLWLRCNEML